MSDLLSFFPLLSYFACLVYSNEFIWKTLRFVIGWISFHMRASTRARLIHFWTMILFLFFVSMKLRIKLEPAFINCAVSLVACSFKNRGEKAATSLSHFSNINDSNIAFRALLPLHVQTLFHHSSPSGRCVSISAVISQRNANCILLACVWKPLWVPWRISDTK